MATNQLKRLLAQFDQDREILRSALQSLKDVVDQYLLDIQNAYRLGNRSDLKRAAHTLKGAASVVLADEVMNICREIEEWTASDNTASLEDSLKQLEKRVMHLKSESTAWLQLLDKTSLVNKEKTIGSSYSILLIEDDRFSANLLASRLRSEGNLVEISYDGEAVSTALKTHRFDAVILGLYLPKKSGFDIITEIRSEHDRFVMPILVLTASESSDDLKKAFDLGANDYITKPYRADLLQARLANHVTISELFSSAVLAKELETLSTLIVTYNNEINNPLSIALGYLGRARKHHDSEALEKVQEALDRIEMIVERIGELTKASEKMTYGERAQLYKVR